MKKILIALLIALAASVTFAATYGPWGESDVVKNTDKLGPTYLMNMPLTINGSAAVQGDCVAVYRQDNSALCGLGKVLDGSGKLTLVCYAPEGVLLKFKVWVSSSGESNPKILDCPSTCDLTAPTPGAFHTGHSLSASETQDEPTVVSNPVITPPDGATFSDSCTITLSCATDGASIYYTTNGATPKTSSKYLYTGPFTVYDTVSIKAVATKEGLTKSGYVTATISKLAMTLENALGASSGMTVTTGGTADWEPVKDSTVATGALSAHSGLSNDDDECESWLQVAVSGCGKLTYYAKTSCEHDDDGTFTWDRLMVYVDGVEKLEMRMDGETGWTQKEVSFDKTGVHTVRWVYHKDESDYDGEDCAWIYGVVWTPSSAPAEPIPDIGDSPTSAQVQEALNGSADENLLANITTGAEYNSYRSWANGVKRSDGSGLAGQQAVKDSPNAWLSYALNCAKLIAIAPADGDVVIQDFEQSTAGGMFNFTVSISNVEVGSAASEEHLKKILGIVGASSLSGEKFEASKVSLTYAAPQGGKVAITAGPTDKTAKSFFMKAKLRR